MFLRASGSMGAAALMTATLYYGMHLLIDSGGVPVFTEAPPKLVSTVMERKEDPKPVKEKLPDRIKPVEVPDIEFPPIVAVNPGDGTYKNPTIDGPSGPTGFDEFPIDRDAQPIFRQEPNFQNITKAEAITLAFDVRPNGSVDKDSIVVLEATSSRLERPAIRAVRRWKYQGKVINGEALWQRDVRVRFTVQPPE